MILADFFNRLTSLIEPKDDKFLDYTVVVDCGPGSERHEEQILHVWADPEKRQLLIGTARETVRQAGERIGMTRYYQRQRIFECVNSMHGPLMICTPEHHVSVECPICSYTVTRSKFVEILIVR